MIMGPLLCGVGAMPVVATGEDLPGGHVGSFGIGGAGEDELNEVTTALNGKQSRGLIEGDMLSDIVRQFDLVGQRQSDLSGLFVVKPAGRGRRR